MVRPLAAPMSVLAPCPLRGGPRDSLGAPDAIWVVPSSSGRWLRFRVEL